MKMIPFCVLFIAACGTGGARHAAAAGEPAARIGNTLVSAEGEVAQREDSVPSRTAGRLDPLVREIDLDVGETADVTLSDGSTVAVRILELNEVRDTIRDAVRLARVTVEIDGQRGEVASGNYRLPVRVGPAQVDCTITAGYNSNGTPEFWGLDKAARLRLWPADSPWVRPGTFVYPVRQRWFAGSTQMGNEPTYVDGGEPAARRNIYYHAGLDIGGSDGDTEIVAATDGLVVAVGEVVLEGHKSGTPVSPRYDVVYLLDARGWYYRYSHLHTIDSAIVPGRHIEMGQRLGLLGKEGGSGGWSHLHFEIKSRQPSGRWGTQEGYPFLWQTYVEQSRPRVIAVARPHHLLRAGESVELDGSRSWSAAGEVAGFRWTFTDGTTAEGPRVVRRYDRPGMFSEVLEVRDRDGNIDRDFAIVQVHDPVHPDVTPPSIHAAYFPTLGIRAGDPVTFKVRSFRGRDVEETWDFGDGSAVVRVRSDGNARVHDPQGYAVTQHRFSRPGQYVVRVERTRPEDYPAITHLHVTVEE